jgi:hypothetical protein
MTEQERLACADPRPMLEFLRGKASDRKLRLFAVACCRRIWHRFKNRQNPRAAEVAEQFAEGNATLSALTIAREKARDLVREIDSEDVIFPVIDELTTCIPAEHAALAMVAYLRGDYPDGCVHWQSRLGSPFHAGATDPFVRVFRDIFSNPFRFITLDSVWLTSTVINLAETIYAERVFDRLPILADALEDAGCTNQDILDHCRQPGEHVRGCWVVDIILSKDR